MPIQILIPLTYLGLLLILLDTGFPFKAIEAIDVIVISYKRVSFITITIEVKAPVMSERVVYRQLRLILS